MLSLKKNKKIIFIIGIFILFFVFSYLSKRNTLEKTQVDRDTYNKITNTEIVHLPQSIIAFAFTPSKVYVYKDLHNKMHQERYSIFIKFWETQIHQSLQKQTYPMVLCLSDGFGERIPTHSTQFTYVKFPDNAFYRKGEIDTSSPTIYPILHKHKKVFAFCRKIGDGNTILIPDIHYICDKGYKNTILKTIDSHRIPWSEKQTRAVWRGTLSNGSSCNFIGKDCSVGPNQREFLHSSAKEGKIPELNCEDSHLSIEKQLDYKYILDIDGWSNTWDATVWKLYSGSVLLKVKGVWEQWYYDELQEYVHYVPVANDFSDLNQQIEWCKTHDKECEQITKNACHFVKTKLSWDRVIKDTIQTMNKYITDTHQ